MADVHLLPTDAELRDKAGEWIVRLDVEDASEDDRARFVEWRQAHPRHELAYNEVIRTWGHIQNMGQVVQAYDFGQTFNESTQRAIRQSLVAQRRGRHIGFATAATLVAALCVGWWVTMRAPETEFQTGVGEHATIKLPDGSSLELNSNSRAHVFFDARSRVVRLERGEGYFEVEQDARRPFWVAAGSSWVAAVGTAFNVDMRASGVRVTVTEGAVKVARSAAALKSGDDLTQPSPSLIKAGQQVSVRGAATEVRSLKPAQLARSLSWREGSVDFKDERLADVVEELNRYSNVTIVLEDEELHDLRIGGTFETNPTGSEALLSSLQHGPGLQVRQEGRTIYVSKP